MFTVQNEVIQDAIVSGNFYLRQGKLVLRDFKVTKPSPYCWNEGLKTIFKELLEERLDRSKYDSSVKL